MGGLRRYLRITPGVHHRLPGPVRHTALRRLLVQGRRPAGGLAQEPGVVGHRRGHRGTDRLLHEPPGGAGVRRPGPLGGARRGPRGGRDGGLVHGATGAPVAPGTAPVHEEGAHAVTGTPHEAPPVMTIPLIILAVASTIGWLLNAPFGWPGLPRQMAGAGLPGHHRPGLHGGDQHQVGDRAGRDGGGVHRPVHRAWACGGGPPNRPELEPAVLRHGWYIDEGVAATVSGPLAAAGQRRQLPGRRGLGRRHRQRSGPPHRPDRPPAAPAYRPATSATTRSGSGSGRPSCWRTWPPGWGADRRDDSASPC